MTALPNLNGYQLRPEYQLPAHEATIEHLRKPCDENTKLPFRHYPAVIDASVGAGKTVSIGAVCKHIQERGGKVLVLARQGEIIEQNSKEYWSMGGKCSVFSASLEQKSTAYNIIMGTEGTVANSLHTAFGYKVNYDGSYQLDENGKKVPKFKPAAILIDECHQLDWQELMECIKDKNRAKETKNQYVKILLHFIEINPDVRIIGYTGSPYRGKTDIIVPPEVGLHGFWREKLYEVPTMLLVSLGYLVPPVFGFGDADHHYDLEKFTPEGGEGAHDFSSKELQAMQREILKDRTKTQIIIEEVIERTKDRNGVLITCAGKRHCEQVSEFLPRGTWAIVTDSTGSKKRRQILNDARAGKIKYVLQIGCLTTGVNVPLWDTCVILRRIGSLTLLVQLIGRILRTLKKEDEEKGYIKDDGLVLDYTDTMESMGDIYDHQMLDTALAERGKQSGETQPCPLCQTDNSMYAVRCIGADNTQPDGRCEHFFQFAVCQNCETKNAPSAQSCRNCEAVMIDPALKLKGKAYTDAEYKPVKHVEFYRSESKGAKGFWVAYHLKSFINVNGEKRPEIAKEHLDPFSSDIVKRRAWDKFLRQHINCPRMRSQVGKQFRTVSEILKSKAVFQEPVEITHRIDPKKFTSIIARKKFRSGREEE